MEYLQYVPYAVLVLLAYLMFKGIQFLCRWNELTRIFDITAKDFYGRKHKEVRGLIRERYWRDDRLLRHRLLTFIKERPVRPSLMAEIEAGLMAPGLDALPNGNQVLIRITGQHNPNLSASLRIYVTGISEGLLVDLLRFNDAQVNPVMKRILAEEPLVAPEAVRPEA